VDVLSCFGHAGLLVLSMHVVVVLLPCLLVLSCFGHAGLLVSLFHVVVVLLPCLLTFFIYLNIFEICHSGLLFSTMLVIP
jgi:hypothetical protein